MPHNYPVHIPGGGRSEAAHKRLQSLKKYLLLLEEGHLEKAAARIVGLSFATVKKERGDNPQFAEAEQIAKAIGNEEIEQVLRDKARDGDYQSIAKFLEANDEKYSRQAQANGQTLIVAVNAGNLEARIDALKSELLRRKADTPLDFVDGNPFINRDGVFGADSEVIDAEIVE